MDGVNGTTTVANPYAYGYNDPLNKTDPLGLRASDCGIAAAKGAQVVSCDTTGDGKYVEVFGDMKSAHNIAIVVPENDTAPGNPLHNKLREDARHLYDETGGSVAVVSWLGYDTPNGISDGRLYSSDLAREGAPALADFVNSFRGKRVSVVAHSYGTLTAALSVLDRGVHPENLVLVGSPGVLVESASAFAPSNVWVGAADADPVVGAELACAVFSPPFAWACTWGQDRVHGPDPSRAEFGAFRFTTGGSRGHSEYFVPGEESLRNKESPRLCCGSDSTTRRSEHSVSSVASSCSGSAVEA